MAAMTHETSCQLCIFFNFSRLRVVSFKSTTWKTTHGLLKTLPFLSNVSDYPIAKFSGAPVNEQQVYSGFKIFISEHACDCITMMDHHLLLQSYDCYGSNICASHIADLCWNWIHGKLSLYGHCPYLSQVLSNHWKKYLMIKT